MFDHTQIKNLIFQQQNISGMIFAAYDFVYFVVIDLIGFQLSQIHQHQLQSAVNSESRCHRRRITSILTAIGVKLHQHFLSATCSSVHIVCINLNIGSNNVFGLCFQCIIKLNYTDRNIYLNNFLLTLSL